MKFKKLLGSGVVLSILTVIVSSIIQLIYIRGVSYYFDKSIFGDYVLLQTIVVAISYICLQIPTLAFSRYYNAREDKTSFINEFRTIIFAVNIIAGLLIYIYSYINPDFEVQTYVLLFLYFFCLSNFSLHQQIILMNLKRERYFIIKTCETLSKFMLPLFLYLYYQTLDSLLFGLVIGYFICLILVIYLSEKTAVKIVFNTNNIKEYIKFAYPMVFVSLLSWAITFSDRYFIDYYLNTYSVGIYSILVQVSALGQVLGQVYTMYVNPKVLKSFESDEKQALIFIKKSIQLLIAVFILSAIIMYNLPLFILTTLIEFDIISNEYYFNTFIILMIGVFVSITQTAFAIKFTLFKKLNVLSKIYVVAFILNLIGNFFIESYGIIAASISTLVAHLVILAMQYAYFMRDARNVYHKS